MSGGSYDYFYSKIRDFADQLRINENRKRLVFQKLLCLVADAAHDIEWVDSGDSGPGGENEAIDKVFGILKGNPEIVEKAAAFDEMKKWLLKEEKA